MPDKAVYVTAVFLNAMPLLLLLACNKYYWMVQPQLKATMASFGW